MNNSPRFLIPTQMILFRQYDSDTSSYDNSLGNKYIYQNIKVGRAGVSFKINGTAKSNSVPLSNENRTFGIALNIYYNNSSTPEFHYQNFSANTDGYQQVSLSVTPEKTNEVVNYIAFAFVYGYNENEMTVDNAEVNLLKVKLNQSCGKAKM